MKKEYSSKQRKLWKLKRKNVVLGQKRSRLLVYKPPSVSGFIALDGSTVLTDLHYGLTYKEVKYIMNLSFEIGKNSAKIQRLRTLIQQEKKNDSI